jgi:Mad3/BUB1 homology region 1
MTTRQTPSTPVWETVKENAAPLERGRNVAVLEQSAAMSAKERSETEHLLAYYEQRVSLNHRAQSERGNVAESHEDPLVDWLSYIKVHQERFPADTHQHFLLLERCFREFHQTARYANDARFIRVCCLYADKTAEPCTTFKELYALGIGHCCATFWNAWAYVAEKQQNFTLTEQIFAKGLRKQAMPVEYLQLRQQRFQRRMTRHWLNSLEQKSLEDEDGVLADSHRQRGVLGALSTSSSTTFRPSQHPPAPIRSQNLNPPTNATFTDRSRVRSRFPQSSSNTSQTNAFPIFVDTEPSSNDSFLDDLAIRPRNRPERETEAARWKENRADAERWNERGGLSSAYSGLNASHTTTSSLHHPPSVSTRASIPQATIRESSFAIHLDDDCEKEHIRDETERRQQDNVHRQARDDRIRSATSSVSAFHKHETSAIETLSHDPLRYVRHPEQALVHNSELQTGAKWEAAAVESSSVQTVRQGNRPIWRSSLLRNAYTGMEQSFEEARASTGYFTLLASSDNFNRLIKQPTSEADPDSSVMSISMEDDTSYVDSSGTAVGGVKSRENQDVLPCKVREDITPKFSASGKPPIMADRKGAPIASRRDSSFESVAAGPIYLNGSMDSSTLDESSAVGGPHKKDEQTINTQLALKELSMMFYSPAIIPGNTSVVRTGGLGPILDESASSDLRNSSIVSECAVTEPPREVAGVSFAIHCDDDENMEGMQNPSARSIDMPNFDAAVLQPLSQETKSDGSVLDCNAASLRRGIGPVHQDNPFRRLLVRDLPSSPGFPIYGDDGSDKAVQEEDNGALSVFRPFSKSTQVRTGISPTGDTATFSEIQSIFRDLKEAPAATGEQQSLLTVEGRRSPGMHEQRESIDDTAIFQWSLHWTHC